MCNVASTLIYDAAITSLSMMILKPKRSFSVLMSLVLYLEALVNICQVLYFTSIHSLKYFNLCAWHVEPVSKQRAFMEELKAGSLNLIVTHPGIVFFFHVWVSIYTCTVYTINDTLLCIVDVLRTVLTLYMEDEDLPLPSLEEVLLCNSTTTAEDVCI